MINEPISRQRQISSLRTNLDGRIAPQLVRQLCDLVLEGHTCFAYRHSHFCSVWIDEYRVEATDLTEALITRLSSEQTDLLRFVAVVQKEIQELVESLATIVQQIQSGRLL